jgi:Tol biopolymer transport system component
VSPDGSRLAYLEGTTVVIVPLDANGDPGAPDVRVDLRSRGLYSLDLYRAGNHAGSACPQWSRDGRRLGYQVTLGDRDSSVHDTVTAEIHAVTLEGKDRVLASFATKLWLANPDFAWSPDGDEIAYATVDGVWRAPIAGGAPDLVWRAPESGPTQKQPMDDDRPISLAWSSRGEIAFTVRGFTPTEPNNPMSGGREHMTVVVIDPDSGRTMLDTAASAAEGTGGELWSPDGSQLVFSGPGRRILVFDPATGSTVRVRPQLEGTARTRYGQPTWSPDGQELLVRARGDRGIALVSFALDGSSGEVRTPWTWALDWAGLDDVDWSAL